MFREKLGFTRLISIVSKPIEVVVVVVVIVVVVFVKKIMSKKFFIQKKFHVEKLKA